MADKVKFAVSVTPIEDVGTSQEGSESKADDKRFQQDSG